MFEDSYAKQKFCEAVAALIGTASLQQRLRFALLPLITLRSSSGTVQHLSPDFELRFQKLMEKLTAKPPVPGEAYPPLEVSDNEAEALADEIFSIFVEVMGGL
jgi:hypothetical protein